MSGDIVFTHTGHHKRPHEEDHSRECGNDSTMHRFNHPVASTGTSDLQNVHVVRQDASSVASSHKRARLFGKYREETFENIDDSSGGDNDDDDDEEDNETALCSNVAVRSHSEDASTGRWLLRGSPSNFSITSTLTEISDTMETISNPGTPEEDLPEFMSPSTCFVLVGANPGADVGDQIENMTSRLDNWSLTRMKTMKISNTVPGVTEQSDINENNNHGGEAMSESMTCRIQKTRMAKREVMRAFRRSNSTITD